MYKNTRGYFVCVMMYIYGVYLWYSVPEIVCTANLYDIPVCLCVTANDPVDLFTEINLDDTQ